jgi:hypothetical protein
MSTLHDPDPEKNWTYEGIMKNTVYGMPDGRSGKGNTLFANDPENYWTREHPLCTVKNRRKLDKEWGAWMKPNVDVWLEKSPPHLTRIDFLNHLFPNARYLHIMRHPIPVAMAAMRWSTKAGDPTFSQRLAHSCLCLDVATKQLATVPKGRFLRFRHEEFCKKTTQVLTACQEFIGVPVEDLTPANGGPTPYKNFQYFQEYKAGKYELDQSVLKDNEAIVNAYGYSLFEPYVISRPWPGLTFQDSLEPESPA